MRWVVEVSPLGSSESPEQWVVEANQWQPALQAARSLRGETGALSGFSIELLADGYRAVDPSTRLRYVIKRAADGMTLSSSSAPTAPLPAATASAPPPASSAPSTARTSTPPSASPTVPTTTVMLGSGTAPLTQPAPPPRAPSEPPAAPAPARASTPAPAPAPAPTPAPAFVTKKSEGIGDLPAADLLYKREELPTADAPLTYREAAWVVPEGTPADAVTRLLLARFDEAMRTLAASAPGRFVNFAVFDHRFEGKPKRAPLATLTWKDWKGTAPEVRLAPSMSVPPAPAPAAAPSPAPAPAPAVAPAPAPAAAFPAPASVASGITHSAAPTPTPAPAPPSPAPVTAPSPSAPARPTRRLSGDELIADLFETMHDLHFLRDAVEGAEFVLALALEKLPSAIGMVHLYDINKREFVIVRAEGPAAASALLHRTSEKDTLVGEAMRKRRAIVIADASSDARVSGGRYALFGAEIASAVCAPVEQAGRFLGLLELANPKDGAGYTEADGHALTYMGEQFAEFVATRGLTIDPERVKPG